MPTQGWHRIDPDADDRWFYSVARIMYAMDPRYHHLKGAQIKAWLNGEEAYQEDDLLLYARVPDITAPEPDEADMCVLARLVGEDTYRVLFLGWRTNQAVPSLVEIDSIIDDLLRLGREWLDTNHVSIGCVVPRTMQYLPIKMLHERTRERGQQTPIETNYLRIVPTSVGDAEYWRVYLF